MHLWKLILYELINKVSITTLAWVCKYYICSKATADKNVSTHLLLATKICNNHPHGAGAQLSVVSRVKLCLVSAFTDIVKDFPKKFRECEPCFLSGYKSLETQQYSTVCICKFSTSWLTYGPSLTVNVSTLTVCKLYHIFNNLFSNVIRL